MPKEPIVKAPPAFVYSARIRLGGSIINEVLRQDLSAAEVVIMRVLHGPESVLDVKERTGKANLVKKTDHENVEHTHVETDAEMRMRLREQFETALNSIKPPMQFDMIFPGYLPMPKRLAEFEAPSVQHIVEEQQKQVNSAAFE